jgi:DNA-binding transcriptional LysR family regulator
MLTNKIQHQAVWVCAPEYLDAFGVPAHLRDLSMHRMITFDGWFDNVPLKLIKDRKTHSVKIEGVLALNDYAGILNAVESGQGIADR